MKTRSCRSGGHNFAVMYFRMRSTRFSAAKQTLPCQLEIIRKPRVSKLDALQV